jgi:5-methylcytosine-specific restriction protein A
MPREFRSTASYDAEKPIRKMLLPFLQERGFTDLLDERKPYGKNESQTIHGADSSGLPVVLRVKLCWRPTRGGEVPAYSAAQLLAKVEGNQWEQALDALGERLNAKGITDMLIVQRDGEGISRVARIPVEAITSIWLAQRDESARLITSGFMGKRRKNPAENGRSPVLCLQDNEAPSVADKLWQHPGVSDLAKLPLKISLVPANDSFDDLAGFDFGLLGRDDAARIQRITSDFPRDEAVRQAVLRRSGYQCERLGCEAKRPYPGFLDVHHILGADQSDRVWNCVALCPNCHREAHAAPERDGLNLQLLEYAGRVSPEPTPPRR